MELVYWLSNYRAFTVFNKMFRKLITKFCYRKRVPPPPPLPSPFVMLLDVSTVLCILFFIKHLVTKYKIFFIKLHDLHCQILVLFCGGELCIYCVLLLFSGSAMNYHAYFSYMDSLLGELYRSW